MMITYKYVSEIEKISAAAAAAMTSNGSQALKKINTMLQFIIRQTISYDAYPRLF